GIPRMLLGPSRRLLRYGWMFSLGAAGSKSNWKTRRRKAEWWSDGVVEWRVFRVPCSVFPEEARASSSPRAGLLRAIGSKAYTIPFPPAKKIRGRPLTSPSEGEDQVL